MKKSTVLILTILVLFLTSQTTTAQGLLFDDDSYAAIPKMPTFYGSKFAETQLKYSLRAFCPRPNHQGLAGSCVGQSLGYGALTILHAIRNGWSTKHEISNNAFSALYIYNQINNGVCERGSTFEDGFNVLLTDGDVKFKDFEGADLANLANCELDPTSSQKAHRISIKDYVRLFELDAPAEEKIGKVRKIIASGSPVMVGMIITSSIFKVTKEKPTYVPNQITEGGHAMVVIGYDDTNQTFELLNSWGDAFGDSGFFKVKYKDFAKYVKYAYYMNLKELPPVEKDKPVDTDDDEEPIIVEETEIELKGQFGFKALTTEIGDDTIQFELLKTKKVDNHYELANKDWGVGSHFQLEAYNMDAGKYVYVFSVDSERKPFVHWPRKEELNAKFFGFNETSLVPVLEASIIIPGEDRVLTKDKAGNDHLFILYSSEEIKDTMLINMIKQTCIGEKDLIKTFEFAFAEVIMPWDDITLSTKKMKVSGKSKKGTMAPIILKVEGGI